MKNSYTTLAVLLGCLTVCSHTAVARTTTYTCPLTITSWTKDTTGSTRWIPSNLPEWNEDSLSGFSIQSNKHPSKATFSSIRLSHGTIACVYKLPENVAKSKAYRINSVILGYANTEGTCTVSSTPNVATCTK